MNKLLKSQAGATSRDTMLENIQGNVVQELDRSTFKYYNLNLCWLKDTKATHAFLHILFLNAFIYACIFPSTVVSMIGHSSLYVRIEVILFKKRLIKLSEPVIMQNIVASSNPALSLASDVVLVKTQPPFMYLYLIFPGL